MKKMVIGKQPPPTRRLTKEAARQERRENAPSWARETQSADNAAREKQSAAREAARRAQTASQIAHRDWVDARAAQLRRIAGWVVEGNVEKWRSGWASLRSEMTRRPPADPSWESDARDLAMGCWELAAKVDSPAKSARAIKILASMLGAPKHAHERDAPWRACASRAHQSDEALRALDELGWKPLSQKDLNELTLSCATEGAIAGLAWLRERGARMDWISVERGQSPLSRAVAGERHECAAWLLSQGVPADLGWRPMGEKGAGVGYTPLMLAASGGDERMARMLIDAGADINKTDQNGHSVISYATHHGKRALAQWMEGLMAARIEREAMESATATAPHERTSLPIRRI